MTLFWARIDVDISSHPKLAGATPAVKLAFIETILWCHKHDTAGAIGASVPFRTFTKSATARADLVKRALLVETPDGGLLIPGFAAYQDTEALRRRRARWRDDKKRQRSSQTQIDDSVRADKPRTSTTEKRAKEKIVRPSSDRPWVPRAPDELQHIAVSLRAALPAQEEEDRSKDIGPP